ncbi:MAG: DUF1761 domain-containing protein [Chlamydiia bacterium]|nr:DUF1761 domain-containing protein [Chlamydiia bacterium]
MELMQVNVITVAVVAVVNFALGWLWWSPWLFGRVWCETEGRNMEECEMTPFHWIGGLLVSFFTAFVVAYLINALGIVTPNAAIKLAAILWFGFFATTKFSDVLWNNKPLKTFAIDAGWSLVSLLFMALVFSQL